MMRARLSPAARADLYGFLSRVLLREMDGALADVLSGEWGRALLPRFAASEELFAVRDPVRREAFFHPDFVHLTIVNLVPYESFYRRADAMMETGANSPVVQFLRRYGFAPDLEAARAVGPDHIGIELELMATLCARESEAAARDDGGSYAGRIRAIERAFVGEHLLAFAPIYLLAVIRNARTVLYGEAAEVALDFLLADADALAEAA